MDHLIHLNAADIRALGRSQTTAVLLPASDFYLKMAYPPARRLLSSGARVALATDFNPGSCPSQDVSFVGLLARMEMKMSLAEVLVGFTVSAAFALGLERDLGSLDVGKFADFCVLDGEMSDLFYQVGRSPVKNTWIGGKKIC
jgi:imidazolonepropionase